MESLIEFHDLMVFIKVVEHENLTKAGRALGLPKSTVSRRLSRLEEQLGAQLIRRSTHSVTLTEQGTLFYNYSLRCIGVLRDGERALRQQHSHPQGLLRIAVPHDLDRSLLGPLLAAYLELYPDVRLSCVVTSEQVDLLRGGFDLAIVAGSLPLAQSSLTATKLGEATYRLYVAPGYLERHGMPQSHVDLPRFDLLATGTNDARHKWSLSSHAGEFDVEFTPRLTCNDLLLLREAVVAGLGIAALPTFLASHAADSGQLVALLPQWQLAPHSFFAVFPRHEVIPAHVRALIDFLVDRLRPAFAAAARRPTPQRRAPATPVVGAD